MPILKASAIAKLRRVANLHFPDLATFREPPTATLADKGQDPDADYPDDWTELLVDEPCRLWPTQQITREGAATGQVQSMGDFRMAIRADATRPSEKARVRINSLDYEIVGIRDRSEPLQLILDLKRIT